MQLSDINFPIGSVNPSGISDEVYFIPKQYIKSWPTIVDDFEQAADNAAYANLNGSFVLENGKTWIRLYSTQGKGKISWEYQGEVDCKVVVNKASLSYPKLNDQGRALAKYAANGDFVFVVKHDGQYFVIGDKDYRATVTPNGDSGDAAGSAKGITMEIECPGTTPLPVYKGTLVLSDGEIDCSGGTAFTVTYNGNGSTGGTAPTDASSPYLSGATVTVIGNTGNLVKTSKNFDGWNTAADGSGTSYSPGDTFAIAANTTLYAQWSD